MPTRRIAVIPGDGVGQEVVPAGQRALETVARLEPDLRLEWEQFPWGSDYYLEHGRMMPEDALTLLHGYDAIYLGAVGSPSVPDHVTLWGLLLPIRQRFNQFVNLRPIKLFAGIEGPLRDKGPAEIDMICVRENTEGEYSGVGGRVHVGFPHEVALQVDVFTRTGVEQIAQYAFELARTRRAHLTSVTKSNASPHTLVLWDEVVSEVARDYPDVAVRRLLVDAAAAELVAKPEAFDVIVASNLFADILTDIGAVIQGSMGIAASANVNPTGGYPGMFEPVHGSAPDIAGKGIANPIGAMWAGALMLENLGHARAVSRLMSAIARVLERREVRTPDLGGEATTATMTDAIVQEIELGGPRSADCGGETTRTDSASQLQT